MFFKHSVDNVHSVASCFTAEPLWPGLYRPITTNCYYLAGRLLFNNQIEVYHAINGIMMILNGLLLFLVARHMYRWLAVQPEKEERVQWVSWFALAPALAFVTRTAHAEVVMNSVEFQGLLYTFFGLSAVLVFIRGRGMPSALGAAVLLLLALLSKEAAIAVVLILLLWAIVIERDRVVSRLAPVVFAGLLWAGLFTTVLRGFSENKPTGFTYDLSLGNILSNFGAYFASFFNWTVSSGDELIMPLRAISLGGSGVGQGFVIGAGLFVCIMAAVSWRSHNRRKNALWFRFLQLCTIGLGFFLLGTAPFVIFEDRLFARYGYFGHAGIALLLGSIVTYLFMLIVQLFSITRTAQTRSVL